MHFLSYKRSWLFREFSSRLRTIRLLLSPWIYYFYWEGDILGSSGTVFAVLAQNTRPEIPNSVSSARISVPRLAMTTESLISSALLSMKVTSSRIGCHRRFPPRIRKLGLQETNSTSLLRKADDVWTEVLGWRRNVQNHFSCLKFIQYLYELRVLIRISLYQWCHEFLE